MRNESAEVVFKSELLEPTFENPTERFTGDAFEFEVTGSSEFLHPTAKIKRPMKMQDAIIFFFFITIPFILLKVYI
jgi:hypothetical protein